MTLSDKFQSRFQWIFDWRSAVGPSATARWAFRRASLKFGIPEPVVWNIRPRQVRHPLQVRLRGSSDIWVFGQIFVEREYACLLDTPAPSLVIDLGANVGYSSAYFLNAFPSAQLIAVEPDEGNVAICQANLAPYGARAKVLHGAVWSKRTKLQVLAGECGDGREWATQVRELAFDEQAAGSVQAWDVGSLIEMSGQPVVDLLKIDVERAELAVFDQSSASWLPKVRNICIELHGKDCEAAFFGALENFDYDLGHSGELTICRNLRLKQASAFAAGMTA